MRRGATVGSRTCAGSSIGGSREGRLTQAIPAQRHFPEVGGSPFRTAIRTEDGEAG